MRLRLIGAGDFTWYASQALSQLDYTSILTYAWRATRVTGTRRSQDPDSTYDICVARAAMISEPSVIHTNAV